MNTLREALQEYLALRRSLGFKMREASRALPRFVAFMEVSPITVSEGTVLAF
jgi:hypothetical protein